jgi:DNA-binding MarR family transcriptional regulator
VRRVPSLSGHSGGAADTGLPVPPRLVAARTNVLRVPVRRAGVLTNRYVERRWDEEVVPDGPFAVYLARDGRYFALAFDLDAKSGSAAARTSARCDATALARMLTAAGIRFVEAASGPSGGRHLLATFPEGLPAGFVGRLARHLARSVTPTLDPTPLCNPATGAIRPPGAPHSAGGRSTLLTPPAAALDHLQRGNMRADFDRLCALAGLTSDREAEEVPSPRGAPRPVPRTTIDLMRNGDLTGTYADRSALAAAITLSFVNANRPYGELETAALDRRSRGLDHLQRERLANGRFRDRSDAEIKAATRRMWAGRVDYARRHPAQHRTAQIEDAVARVLAAADGDPRRWGGQAGPTDLAVLRALLALALRAGTLTLHAGIRHLSLHTGVSRSSAARSLRRLVRDGWLVLVQAATGTSAAEYHIQVPPDAALPDTVPAGTLAPAPPTTERLRTALSIQSHDALSGQGLGRYAAAVLIAVIEGSAALTDIARHSGLSIRSTRKQLRRLRAAGMVSSTGTVWRAVELDELDAAARRLGVAGAGARRAAEYALERDNFAWYLADFAARRGWSAERGQYRLGHAELSGPDARPCPLLPYPRRGGRASWRLAQHLLAAGATPWPDVEACRSAGADLRSGTQHAIRHRPSRDRPSADDHRPHRGSVERRVPPGRDRHPPGCGVTGAALAGRPPAGPGGPRDRSRPSSLLHRGVRHALPVGGR